MKLSSIGSFLSQSEAAVLAVLAEKIMRQAERGLQHPRLLTDNERADYADAQDTAYALRCVAEQSILANDGELFKWLQKVRESEIVKQGWIDLDDMPLNEKEST